MYVESDLRAIIAEGETLTVEFKSDRGQFNQTELVEAVTCLANTQGGLLLVGVENDGRITGERIEHCDLPSAHLAALVANRTVPSFMPEVEKVQTEDGVVVVLQISRAQQLIATTDGRTLTRRLDARGNPMCRVLFPHEIALWHADRSERDSTAQLVEGASWGDLDLVEFARLRRMLREYRGDASLLNLSDEELARALGLVRRNDDRLVPTVAGLLLIGSEEALRNYIPTHEVAFQVFRGQDLSANEIYKWPLLRVLERILEAFTIRNDEEELAVGLFRVGVPAYDTRAFREAVNNALVHRDYGRLGAVHIQMHANGILVDNPGGFIQGVRIDRLLVVGPSPRNPLLAEMFKRIGLVERTGRGVGIIYAGSARWGRGLPDYSRSSDTKVIVFLPGGPADLGFVRILIGEENRRKTPFSLDELLVINQLHRDREVGLLAIMQTIQKSEVETRRVLEILLEADLVERRGAANARIYILSARLYRHMGKPEAYVRRIGFDTIRNSQMILQYIEAHHRITAGEVRRLCNVNRSQATHLLKQLVLRGELRLVGTTRNSYYIRTGNNADEAQS